MFNVKKTIIFIICIKLVSSKWAFDDENADDVPKESLTLRRLGYSPLNKLQQQTNEEPVAKLEYGRRKLTDVSTSYNNDYEQGVTNSEHGGRNFDFPKRPFHWLSPQEYTGTLPRRERHDYDDDDDEDYDGDDDENHGEGDRKLDLTPPNDDQLQYGLTSKRRRLQQHLLHNRAYGNIARGQYVLRHYKPRILQRNFFKNKDYNYYPYQQHPYQNDAGKLENEYDLIPEYYRFYQSPHQYPQYYNSASPDEAPDQQQDPEYPYRAIFSHPPYYKPASPYGPPDQQQNPEDAYRPIFQYPQHYNPASPYGPPVQQQDREYLYRSIYQHPQNDYPASSYQQQDSEDLYRLVHQYPQIDYPASYYGLPVQQQDSEYEYEPIFQHPQYYNPALPYERSIQYGPEWGVGEADYVEGYEPGHDINTLVYEDWNSLPQEKDQQLTSPENLENWMDLNEPSSKTNLHKNDHMARRPELGQKVRAVLEYDPYRDRVRILKGQKNILTKIKKIIRKIKGKLEQKKVKNSNEDVDDVRLFCIVTKSDSAKDSRKRLLPGSGEAIYYSSGSYKYELVCKLVNIKSEEKKRAPEKQGAVISEECSTESVKNDESTTTMTQDVVQGKHKILAHEDPEDDVVIEVENNKKE